MNRDEQLKKLSGLSGEIDIVVVGGGATGLGIAVDAASRGLSVALFEKYDFAKVTSSRSTKLAHGGVRYLAQGDVALVREALHERGRMRKNAPHLVKDETFVISNYSLWDNFLYTCGLTVYDMLSWGGLSLGRSKYISKKKVQQLLPHIRRQGLKGGVTYHDGQFDDSRMAVNLAQTAVEHGAIVINYCEVTGIVHNNQGKAAGATARDRMTGENYTVNSKCVINAAGVFVDEIMRMDVPHHERMVQPSQGVHIVLDQRFLGGDKAIMVPKTSDGRVLFAVPWHDKVVVGTTDIPRESPEAEPRPLDEEIEFILNTAGLYMDPAPTRADIRSVFAGQRPLAAPKKDSNGNTKEISRSHKIIVSDNDLITITGGKWTTYRRMAEDTVDKAISMKKIEDRKCITKDMKIHGYKTDPDLTDHMYIYGSDENAVRALWNNGPQYSRRIHPDYPFTAAEVVWAVQHEMALTVEDVLARRVRLLFLDARAAVQAAPLVASIIAATRGLDEDWERDQVETFTRMASHYIVE